MTAYRDQVLAHVIGGMVASGDVDTTHAVSLAEATVAAACGLWGHNYDGAFCVRCGHQNEEDPPVYLGIPAGPRSGHKK